MATASFANYGSWIRVVSSILIIFPSLLLGAEPRQPSSLQLPRDCSYIAHDGNAKTASDRCADQLEALQLLFKKSPLVRKCSDWPNLDTLVMGDEDEAKKVKFFPLKSGKFLMQVTCSTGAYNEQFLLFIFDYHSKQRPLAGVSPQLIMFPIDPVFQINAENRRWGLKPYEAAVYARDFDPEKGILYIFSKGIGDGTTGYYMQYAMNSSDLLPRLQTSFVKNEENHAESYSYTRHKSPTGKSWSKYTPQKELKGCLTTLERAACR